MLCWPPQEKLYRKIRIKKNEISSHHQYNYNMKSDKIGFYYTQEIKLYMSHKSLHKFKGNKFIYIGIPKWTGTKKFHKTLKKKWILYKTVSIPNWDHVDDKIYLYTRKIKKKWRIINFLSNFFIKIL